MMPRVKIRPELWGSLLLLAACRQPNPEWKGADEGAMTSDSPPETTSPETTSPATTMDPPATTMEPPADSSGEPSTEGEPCNNDQQCPAGWVCGPMGCQRGEGGDPCTSSGDCQAPTGICGPADTCQAGAAGDPCGDNNDCLAPTGICGPNSTCQAGETGDPCSSPSHCVGGLMCMDDVCDPGA
jgi:hypothetical protein